MGNKKIGLGLMLNLIGAMFAYLIGSGFASGQETMQYFSGWGSVWTSLGVAVIALLLSCLACASMLAKDDKSKKYKLICVIAGICVYIITLFVPYETLLNYIMTYCGYSGCVVAVVCIVRYFIIKSRDKKEGLFTESV